MSSKTFYLPAPINAQVIEISGVSRPGLHSVVITTTDGQIPSGGSLVGNTRTLGKFSGTNNIDWNNTHVKFYDGPYASKYQSSNIKTVPLQDFSFDVRYLTQDAGGESWSLTSAVDLYLGFSNGSIWLRATGGQLAYSKPMSGGAYNFVDWGANGSGAAVPGGWSELNSLKFRTQANLNALLLSQELQRTIIYTELASDKYVDTLNGRVIYNGQFYYDIQGTNRYAEEFTLSSAKTFNQMAIFGATEWTPSGTLTLEIHAVTASVLASSPNRTPEASVAIPLTSSNVSSSDADWGYAIFGKLANSVTLQPGNYTFAMKYSGGSSLKFATYTSSGSTLKSGATYGSNNPNTSMAFLLSTVTPASNPPTNISISSASVSENAAVYSAVGTLSATDAEGGPMTFSLVSGGGSTDNASFRIVGNELQTAVPLNYETKSSYSIRIGAMDSTSLSFEKEFTISVTNANEAPTSISLSANSIAEGNEINAVIGTLSAIEADVGDSVSFSIVSGGDKFNISGTQLRASVVFDYDAASSHPVTVRATDAGGLSLDQSFTISVVNAGPVSISLGTSSISESASGQATVGMLSAVDPGGGSCSFSLVAGAGSADNASFQISGNQLKLASGVSLDYENKSSYSVRIQATDAHGATVAQSFTVTVLNSASDDPLSLTNASAQILTSGAVVATVSAVPTLAAITFNGQALPSGSIVRYSETGQKFIKIDGGQLEYAAIEVEPKSEWGWSEDGQEAWQELQSM